MRQVKARLLKFGFEEEDDSDDDKMYDRPQVPETVPVETIPSIPSIPPPIITKRSGKKESKWGKTTSNEFSILPMMEEKPEKKI